MLANESTQLGLEQPSSDDKALPGKQQLYRAVWRWHFYAGLLFAPFILILAVTGSVYLFKPQLEQWMYKDRYVVEAQGNRLAGSQLIENVQRAYPEAQIKRYRPGESSERSAEVRIARGEDSITVFVDPYTGNMIGEINDADRLIDRFEEFHGELMLGTTGDRIVELAACWTLILILSGVYLWFPKQKLRLAGVLLPRFHKGKKVLLRDLHAVPAFWLSLAILFLVITGLLWSGFWGTKVQHLATNAGAGYPPSIWVGSAPSSTVKTKDIADVPWAAQNVDVPMSASSLGYVPVSVDDIVATAARLDIYPTYEVVFPRSAEGVYTLSAFPPKARDEATVHIDQYTGAVLADYRYQNYEPIGKLMAWGITVHKGLEYGLLNQLLGLLVCVGIVGVVASGILLWWRRRPSGRIGAPKAPELKKLKGLALILLLLGLLFPLAGLSMLAAIVLDQLLIRRIPRLKTFFNA